MDPETANRRPAPDRAGGRRSAAASILLASCLLASPSYGATTTVYATIDNKVMIMSANANVAETVYGNTDLGIGCNWELYYYDGFPYQSFLCARSLVWFDIDSLIAGKTILRAVLRLYPYLLPGAFDTSYSVAPITSEWHYDTVRWSNQPTAGSAVATLPPPVTTALPMEFDVTSTVRAWASGALVNRGFRIRDVADTAFPYATLYRIVGLESLEYWFGSARRPQLVLEIADVAAPTLTFVADPPRIPPGGSSTLRWQSTNATTCRATTRNWTVVRLGTTDSKAVSPTTTQEYGLACEGPGGEIERRVTVTVPEAAASIAGLAAVAALVGLKSGRRAPRLRPPAGKRRVRGWRSTARWLW